MQLRTSQSTYLPAGRHRAER